MPNASKPKVQKQSKSRKPPPKGKVTVTTTTVSRVPKPQRGKRRVPRRAGTVTRAMPSLSQFVTAKNLTDKARAICLNALLPYEGPSIRIRSDGDNPCYSIPSAVAKHFLNYPINVATVMGTNEKSGSTYTPRCGLVEGQPIWGDLSLGFPIIHTLDSRLLGIVPQRSNFLEPSTGHRFNYVCNKFINNQMLAPDVMLVPYVAKANGMTANTTRRDVIGKDGICWLDFGDLFLDVSPPGAGSSPYGDFHPALDYEGRRYFWVDSAMDEITPPNALAAAITLSFHCTSASPIADPSDANLSSLQFVMQLLPDDSNSDELTMEANFNTNSPDFFALIEPKESGYYCLGLKGALYNNAGVANTADAIISNLTITYATDALLNVFSRHIVNQNIVSSSNSSSNFFVTEQANSAALLIRNVTPTISSGGIIHAISSQDRSPWYRTTSAIDQITSQISRANLRYSGSLSKGTYGWVRNELRGFRTCVDVVKYADNFEASVVRSYSLSRKSIQPLSRLRGMNIYWVVPPAPSSATTTVPTNLNLLFCVQLEYTTMNQTPVLSLAGIDEEDLKPALKLLQDVSTFTENPAHLSGFLGAVNKAFNGVRDFYSNNRSGFQQMFRGLSSFGGPLSALGSIGSAADFLLN